MCIAKTICILVLPFLMIECNTARSKKTIIKAKILYVNDNILTLIAVKCNNFDDYFKDSYKEVTITESKFLRNVEDFLIHSRNVNDNEEIDVRKKIYLYLSDSSMSTICINKFNQVIYNGKRIAIDSNFFQLTTDILK